MQRGPERIDLDINPGQSRVAIKVGKFVPTEITPCVALEPTIHIVGNARPEISARDELEGRMARARWGIEP